jgi:hypothetical protein
MRGPSGLSVGAFAVTVTAGVLLAPGSGRACSCSDFELLAPADGQTDVPTNAKLWLIIAGQSPFTPTLTGPGGEVPFSVLHLGPEWLQRLVITPVQELTPGATYELATCARGRQGQIGQCRKVTRFSVGSRRADQPGLPVERGHSAFYLGGEKGSSCGSSPTRTVEFKVDWAGLLLVADIDGANPFPADPGGLLFAAITNKRYAYQGHFSLGTGPCVSPHWPAQDTAQVRFGVVNIAGEFSGWSQPSPVTLPEDGGCQMAGGRGPRAPWTAGGLAILLLLLRRLRFRANA